MQSRHPIIRTKLTPFSLIKRTLYRPRLTDLLLQALDYPLTVVQAGAGFGKSTALAALADAGVPLVWYHLDTEDDDPLVFLLYLLNGFSSTFSGRFLTPLALLDARQDFSVADGWHAVIDTLLNEVSEEVQTPVLLVLDNAHLLGNFPAGFDMLDRLLRHAPANLHVIASTRYPLRFPQVGQLRLTGNLHELGEQDLAFTAAEIADLFASQYGISLSAQQADVLAEQTEGWAIALQLVRQGFSGDGLAGLPVRAPSGGDLQQDLFAYLAQEVLDQQPADVQEFLLTTSVLRHLTADLCDCLRGASGSAEILASLVDSGLFVVPVDDTTMRYHYLFREFLTQRLDDERRRQTHLSAMTCLRERGSSEQAVYHALQAGAFSEAAGMIEELGRDMIHAGRTESLAGWIAGLPPDILVAYPLILTYLGDIARQRSRFSEALQWYKQGEERCRAQNDMQGVARALRGQARVYLDTVNPSEAEVPLREAQRLIDGHEDRELHASLLDLLAENQINRGKAEEAHRLREEARALRDEGPTHAEIEVRVLLRTGRLHEARQILEERAAEEKREPVLHPRAHRETLLLLSLIHAYMGESELAFENAAEGMQRGKALDSPFVTAVGYMRQGHAWLIREGADHFAEAEHCFQQAVEVGDRISVARLKIEAYWGLSMVAGFQGDLDRAESYARQGIEIGQQHGDEWIVSLIRVSLGASFVQAGKYQRAQALLALALNSFDDCSDPFGMTIAKLWQCIAWAETENAHRLKHGLADLLEMVNTHRYQFLLTNRTLLGLPDPRRIVPLLLIARDDAGLSGLARPILRHMGLSGITIHSGYQLRVEALGPLRLWRGRQEIVSSEWTREKARQLFLLMLSSGDVMLERERIWFQLWPDLDQDAAAQGFKVALNALYNVLEPDRARGAGSAYIERDGSQYGFRRGADIWVDSDAFQRAIALGNAEYLRNPRASIEPYWKALSLYRGDFLEEYVYAEWSNEKRIQLREFFLHAADRLARVHAQAEEWELVIEACQNALQRDSCWEHAYRLMMLSHARMGNRPQALRVYARAVELLRDELDTTPTQETVDLHNAIANDVPFPPLDSIS